MKQSEALFAVIHSQPATIEEIQAFWDASERDSLDPNRQLFRQGLLVRREREQDGPGRNPYEYAVAEPATGETEP